MTAFERRVQPLRTQSSKAATGYSRPEPDVHKWSIALLTTSRIALVQATLDEVAALRSNEFRGDDETVLRLLADYGETSDVAELLWADLPATYYREDVADLLSLWSWRTKDNGAHIMRTLERWVSECSDESKVWVALHQEAYPFIDHMSRIDYLLKVKSAFPTLGQHCQSIIDQSRLWLEAKA